MQTTVPRDTIWRETYVPLDLSAVCIDAERIRVLIDRVPFIEWAGGRETIYIYLTLCEEEQWRGYSNAEWETLSKLGRARLEHPDGIATLPEMLIEDTRRMTDLHADELYDSSIGLPWRDWVDFIADPDEIRLAVLTSTDPNSVQPVEAALHQSIKDSNRLSPVTYMRLWIHAYATREWADVMMFEWGVKRDKLVDSDCSVHLLVARTDLDDSFPGWATSAWAIDAFHLNARFFIRQGSWPEEILHKGRFFNSGKLAIMNGAWE
ncbi:hypothetical protein KC345_g3644 [Hortaea werneckii]|nr:hypothetical protein KC345_g3644 [Hortaea werneckii]